MLRDRERRFAVPRHPQVQRLDALQQQERVERRQGGAERAHRFAAAVTSGLGSPAGSDLRQLFAAPAGIKASSYLRRRKRRLLNAVCQWTNEKKFRVNELLARLTDRCDQLGLHVLNDDPQQDFRVTSFITTLVMNYLFTGRFKRTK